MYCEYDSNDRTSCDYIFYLYDRKSVYLMCIKQLVLQIDKKKIAKATQKFTN